MIKRDTILAGFKVLVSLSLGALGLWFITRGTAAADVLSALRNVQWGWVIAAVFTILLTIFSKAARWGLLFFPHREAPLLPALLQGIVLGQFFNQLLPVARLGDLVRLLSLPEDFKKGRILGTLVLEKTLDSVMVVLTFFILVPFVVMPDVISSPAVLGGIAFLTLGLLYLLAFEANRILRLTRWSTAYLPVRIGRWLLRLAAAGLEGLAALRHRRAAVEIVAASAGIAILSIVTPFLLFQAFGFDLSFAAAGALNLAILIGSLPSSSPGNLGVFEFLTVVTLRQLGLTNEGALVGFAFLFHLVVIGPVIIWGSWLIVRQEWPLHLLQRRLARAGRG